MSEREYNIEVHDRDGNIVRRFPYRHMVTFQLSEESEPMCYMALSLRGNQAHWAKKHLATPSRAHYTLVCYGERRGSETRELVGRFRIHICNSYVSKPKKRRGRGTQYASMVAVAEEHLERLKASA